MNASIRTTRELAPNARLDCCPYDGDSNKTAFFIRLGPGGPWLSNARRSPRAAWTNAAARVSANPPDITEQPALPLDETGLP